MTSDEEAGTRSASIVGFHKLRWKPSSKRSGPRALANTVLRVSSRSKRATEALASLSNVKIREDVHNDYGVITIERIADMVDTHWVLKFAWTPVRIPGHGWTWLKPVMRRRTYFADGTIAFEYRTVAECVAQKMLGDT